MTFAVIIMYFLLAFMIIGAIIAVETRDLLSSIIAVGAVGFGLSVIFLFLGAPDLAITQVVVEIICLVILIRATVTRDDTTYDMHRDTFAVAMALIFVGAFIAFAAVAYKVLPEFGNPIFVQNQEKKAVAEANGNAAAKEGDDRQTPAEYYIQHGFEQTKAPNLVTSIVLDFRAYDTLGEATVIFVSVIGAYVVLRKVGRRREGREAPASEGKDES
jgi:multisubunit Na+/H+ antiporter MnhB subunit